MKIGILGTGPVGRDLGTGFIKTGHQVMLGSRTADNANAVAWQAEAGAGASVGTFADTAAFGELLVVAVKGSALSEVIGAAGVGNFAGKVVIDTVNPLDFSKGYPDLSIKGDDSAGETLQRLLPGAHVVKAFNTVNSTLMFRPDLPGGPPDMMIAGNDAAAKATVTAILTDFGWPTIDLGNLYAARWLEAFVMTWVLACQARGDWRQAFKLLRAAPAT